jgi:oligopeptide transport system permease protein
VITRSEIQEETLPRRQAGLWADAARRFARNKLSVVAAIVALLLVLMAVFAPLLAPYDYLRTDLRNYRKGPSLVHPFGTDELGRDYLSRIIFGARVSISVGIGVQATALLIGIPLGALAGGLGGRVDHLIMRFVDFVYAVPSLLLTILIMVVLGSGLLNVFLALAATSWIEICRLTRASLLSLRETDFVLGARAVGATQWRIMFKYLLPNSLTPLIVSVTLGVPTAIFREASLSFIGIGVNPPMPSWGQMVGLYYRDVQAYWYLTLFPALMIAITTCAFVLAGDGLRDALDPSGGGVQR